MSAAMPVYSESFIPAEPWKGQAACMQVDPDMFFPTKGDHESARNAVATCRTCPVVGDCLQYALEHRETQGVWGGLTPMQRKRIARTPVCRRCKTPIGHLSKQHRYCESCAVARRAESQKAYAQKGAA
ncbi:WhiB family transcriptional regulator [Microbacterium sp. MYb64]|uniref:WhiB family transcriptional regulator n=1 Tax=Microbacterium sp. MYb64 TaxID=1848691 RepID=UPI000CFB9775|nr:WhiB family transcriptional regulator [Microbacterium sp. MYb64]PRB01779.1 hypothetical protein CQ044_16660 [Microbacterium sp. MYb64]